MEKKIKKSLFVFRRDLRADDNNGLEKATALSKMVIPCFIFDPRQVDDQNSYKSDNAIQFMIESLFDLDAQLQKHNGRLSIFYGQAPTVIESLIENEKVDAVFCNKDYTPFSRDRDFLIKQICIKKAIPFIQSADALLNEPEAIKTQNGTPYSVFTPFYRHCAHMFPVPAPITLKKVTFNNKMLDQEFKHIHTIVPKNNVIKVHGGTSAAQSILEGLLAYSDYLAERDYPALDATTHLSAHLKFGTISIRQTFHAIKKTLGNAHPLLRQLYWRDFFYHVAYNNPTVFGHAYHAKYDALSWDNNQERFQLWCQGVTGFPIVDAGMREINETGYMHNRVRMIVASFLTKDLHIDWRWGEQYFACKLVDYDPAINNGNWQWAASTGCDAQPYFRIFNPWLQQARFDPECEYIKRWIPELKNIPSKVIHTWYKAHSSIGGYPLPIVEHAKESSLAKELYKKC